MSESIKNLNHNLVPDNLDSYWMPFTPNRQFKENPRFIVSARGMHYFDSNDHKILDGSAGLWCVNAGHYREEINTAVQEQLSSLDFAHSFNSGHPHAFNFANRLVQHFPDPLNHVFFTNSGSESVDTSLKIALAYQKAIGQGSRQRLVGREKGYHGMGFGGVSVGGLVKNRAAFGMLLPGTDHIRHTLDIERNAFSKGLPVHGAELADDLQRLVELHGAETIAAVIVEPVAGAGGVILPPQGYLERLREICTENGILLIFDEVITGFGRLGATCAAERFGVIPDIMTTAKGITNATIPMGAVFVSETVYQAFMAAEDPGVELSHGYTYSGHPAACAASLAVLDIYEKEGVFTNAATMAPYFQDAIFGMKDISGISDIRGYGMLAGIDLSPEGGAGARGMKIHKKLFSSGVYIKFTGDTALVAPPLVSTKENIDEIISGIKRVLEDG